MNNTLSFAGEYELKEFSILKSNTQIAVDIRNQITSIILYEDLFSPMISGTAVVKDTLDLINVLGRGGKNLIRIVVGTPTLNKDIVGYFHLYKIADRSLTAERTQVYTLNFISSEYIQDQNAVLSKNFSGAPHQVFQTLMKDHLKTSKSIRFSEAANRVQYVSNYWTAIDNMAYLAEHAVSKTGAADYVFFENRDGFNFVSIEELGTGTLTQKFEQSDYSMTARSPDGTSVVRDLNREFAQIQDIRVPVLYDFISDLEMGMIHNRVATADPVRKSYRVNDRNLKDETRKLMNKNLPYREVDSATVRTNIMVAIRQFGTHVKQDLSNANWVAKRVMHAALSKAIVIEIDVMGRTDYTVGNKVNVSLNQIREILKDEPADSYRDKMLSGDYIISAIAHTFDGKSHTCQLELMKDSVVAE